MSKKAPKKTLSKKVKTKKVVENAKDKKQSTTTSKKVISKSKSKPVAKKIQKETAIVKKAAKKVAKSTSTKTFSENKKIENPGVKSKGIKKKPETLKKTSKNKTTDGLKKTNKQIDARLNNLPIKSREDNVKPEKKTNSKVKSTNKVNEVKTPIKSDESDFSKKQLTKTQIVKNTPEPKGKFELEYVIHCSPSILFDFLYSPSGLSEWFCDDVNIRNDIYQFEWDGSEQSAKLLNAIEEKHVRFQWIDRQDGTYFEFRIEKDELTNDISLLITDFADSEEEKKSSTLLWNSQVDKLLHVLGSYF